MQIPYKWNKYRGKYIGPIAASADKVYFYLTIQFFEFVLKLYLFTRVA